jgi:hypothetical protein
VVDNFVGDRLCSSLLVGLCDQPLIGETKVALISPC